MRHDLTTQAGPERAVTEEGRPHSVFERPSFGFVNILLQNKRTLNYVEGVSGWTTKRQKARVFGTGLEALFFCFNHDIANMQIVGDFGDARVNFAIPVTDLRGD